MTSGSRSSAERRARPSGLSEPAVRAIEVHLAKRETRRERLHDQARTLRRRAQGLMVHLHEGRPPAHDVARLRKEMRALARRVRSEGAVDAPLVRDAIQEAVEAVLLDAALRETPFPAPGELGVEVEPYLLGLGDVVGELRRRALTDLADDDLASAERRVHLMEALYQTLMRFDTTRAIVPLKPKQDTARSLLERTRGEVVMARVHARHRSFFPPRADDEVAP